ncbi:ring-opening amidohydrolase [Acidithiobacillus ferrooxidans]|uniref:cyanuric acid amidohydrolase n=1 Tax=Acidithiobacillus ferrooxidans TaxID=920 RepID=UPI001C06CBAA|nr:ring-opening amidohydrolase [Acidithiobacillus ferrooxidans]MBU2774834.1 ring-opening amidohydrolase [Acidithiobacillus ferrooxidans]
MRTQVHRFFSSSPADVSGLAGAVAAGEIQPQRIVAILGKTEGNGAINDFSRGLAIMALGRLLGPLLDCPAEDIEDRVFLSFSGGTEGVTCPHYMVFSVDETLAPAEAKGLALAVGYTRSFAPEEAGRLPMILETARVVRALQAQLDVGAHDVHLVQIKGAIPPVPTDPGQNMTREWRCDMAWSRGASALGVALALGEVSADALDDEMINRDWTQFSARASVSAKPALLRSEICLFANAPGWSREFEIAHSTMRDILDVGAIYGVLEGLGLRPVHGQLPKEEAARICGAFAKSDADPRGTVRGRRHTMWTDGDISDMRHSRSVVSSLLSGVLGESAVYVSTRAEHQGPLGGGPVAIIARQS